MNKKEYVFLKTWKLVICFFLWSSVQDLCAQSLSNDVDTLTSDTLPYSSDTRPTVGHKYRYGNPFSDRNHQSSLYLQENSQLDLKVRFRQDSTLGLDRIQYILEESLDNKEFRPSSFMNFKNYNKYTNRQIQRDYFKDKVAEQDGESALGGKRLLPKIYVGPVIDRIFGGSYVNIEPTGFANLDIGGNHQRLSNPSITRSQQRSIRGNFDMQLNVNLKGKIGEKLIIDSNFDNKNSFDFQNNLNVGYNGYEEDVLKKIELGNISMPVSNSLMSGAQSLYGIKTDLQFGKLWVTAMASNQRGKQKNLSLNNSGTGVQGTGTEFEVLASNYDENKHFFLAHFFRDHFETWLSTAPQITSGINVTRVEVYTLNRTNETRTTRNIIGLTDLGEGFRLLNDNVIATGGTINTPADNDANNIFNALNDYNANTATDNLVAIFPTFENSKDYVRISTARKLNDTEYILNKELGYISLKRRIQSDETLAVSYEYTYNGQVFKVGELTEDYQERSDEEVVYLKLLRPNRIDTQSPSWNLMMKNIYSLNSFSINREGFQLRIIYRDDATGQDNPSLHEGRLLKDKPLIEVFGLDRLNQNNDRQPDGNFDFIEGVSILKNGTVVFPVLEPFGETLLKNFEANTEGGLIEKYVFDELYTQPQATSKLNANKNKFILKGTMLSGSASQIKIPSISIAEGSVIVYAGGNILPSTDYTVDYNLGVVRILNDGVINSGKEISIAYEERDAFNIQTRTLLGARLDYRFNEDFNIGATVFHLKERTGSISRYALGNEPNKNLKYGLDLNYQKQSRLLTKLVNALPLISTKEESRVNFNLELAQFKPGTSNKVDGERSSYIDDFEYAIIPYNIAGWQSWKFASTPPEFSNSSNLDFNYKKAKVAWFNIDNSIFYASLGNSKPDNISDEDLENHYERPVLPQEIYRQRDQNQINSYLPIFNVAFFPEERAPYNYNPSTDVNGLLPNPEENWGGITRPILNEVNFTKTNIEYLEFWVLDPFINGERGRVLDGRNNTNNITGGELIFNFGSVSEDVAPDNKHAFENGLPTDGSELPISSWGRITDTQFLTKFFENSSGARENQDIGLDGLRDDEESLLNADFSNFDDPSGDNFTYFLDESYDNVNAKILQRYKNWNGLEGNSPIGQDNNQQFIPAATTLPDNEDLNNDNTISKLEEYFEYRIPLEYEASNEGNLKNSKYIVDQIADESREANWYLFRIPLQKYTGTVGSPTFENMKFVRMYLTGWKQPVVLRFAKLQLVGSQWRKYEQALNEPGLNFIPETVTSDFNISVVSIEENSIRTSGGSPYILPPGVTRDIDNSTTVNQRINEQSLQICIEDLEDRDARAVYKNVSYDLNNIGRMKMFLHAENFKEDQVVDDEIVAFLRLGTDFDENYYEISLPLKVSPDNLSPNDPNLANEVWPSENILDISLLELQGVKSQRNRAGYDSDVPYVVQSKDLKYTFTVKGRPDMSAVKIMMLGVKNPNDGVSGDKSFCVWANELRVTDFSNLDGLAARARLNTQLADMGTFSATASYTSVGFGGIQQRISERSREETRAFDLSTNLNIEKFLRPQKTGLVIPFYASYQKSSATPQFDPLDPDVKLEASLEVMSTEEQKNYRRIVEDKFTRRSINFSNVRKVKTKPDAKKNIYDIENLSFSYAYTDQIASNFSTQQNINKTVTGNVNYNFAPKKKVFEPFKNLKSTSAYLKLLKSFNFSFSPDNIAISGDLRRNFRLLQYYNNELTTEGVSPQYERLFTFIRNYSFRWSIFKSVSLTYNAVTNAVIDEPEGSIQGDINTQEEKKFIWQEIVKLGRTKNFSQNISVNYKVPLDKFPLTDWISTDLRYKTDYQWIAGAISLEQDPLDSLYFGNFIKNGRQVVVNTKLEMKKLYNKVSFLKQASGSGGNNSFGKSFLKFLMMLKSVNGTYSRQETTELSGINFTPKFLGMDSDFTVPGFKFLLGDQDSRIKNEIAEAGFMVSNTNLNSPFKQTKREEIKIRAEIEPMKGFRVQVTMDRGITNQYQEIFRYNGVDAYETITPSRSGNYNVSFLSIASLDKTYTKNSSTAFDTFEKNLTIAQSRLNQLNSEGTYSKISQDVLLPSFLAAYSGKDVSTSSLSPFPKTPLPNWRVDFSGLSKLDFIKNIFPTFTITHAYKSTYSVSSFTNSLAYGEDIISLDNTILNYPLASANDEGKLVPVYIVNQATIVEQFAPLIGINIRTKSNVSLRVDYKKGRNLSLNMSNAQITESGNTDFTVNIGYTKAGMKLPFKVRGKTITLQNQLTFRLASSFKRSVTIQRKIEEESTITNGNDIFQLRPTITYKVNKSIDLSMYFDRNVTSPKVFNSFPRANTAFGFQLRFGFAQ